MDTHATAEPTRAEHATTGPAVRAAEPASAGGSPLVAFRGTAMRILDLQRLAGNRAVAAVLAGAQRKPEGETLAQPTATGTGSDSGAMHAGALGGGDQPKPAPPRMTGYVGMNPEAGKEVRTLEKAAGKDALLATTGDAALEAKLKEEPAIADFVFDDLGISPGKIQRWEKAIDALVAASPKARDTLGELMRWMNQAEDGLIVLDRLVLSGHSNGFELWGTPASPNAAQKPGTLVLEQDLGNVAAAFPKAAAQVRSIMFSACETVGAVETVLRIFPNVDSVWSYAGFSPDIAGGSGKHIETWEKATEQGGTPGRKDARGVTAIWTRTDKWLVRDPGTGNVESLYTQAMSKFMGPVMAMLRGDRDVPAKQLKDIYDEIQKVVQHPAISGNDKLNAIMASDVTLRIRHWPSVRRNWTAKYATQLVGPYRELGLTPPAWATIGRRELYVHIQALKDAFEKRRAQAKAIETIDSIVIDGLGRLNPKIILTEWNE